MRFLPSTLTLLSVSTFALVASAAEPIACTMDAKLCPDGVTYVGRQGPDCAFAPCPVQRANAQCDPYRCADGTQIDRCDAQGNVLQYFAEPCLTHGGEVTGPFRDVPDTHPNAEAIAYMKASGIVQGYDDGTFRPDQTINRAEFLKILLEAKDAYFNAPCDEGVFPDVSPFDWFVIYTLYAKCNGIISGYPDGTFRPAANINFVEAAKIMVNAFDLEATTTISACDSPTDIECTWYRSYVLMLEAHAAIPTSINHYSQQITRGEMAEMIYRLKTGKNDKPSQSYVRMEGNEHCDRMKAMGWSCE